MPSVSRRTSQAGANLTAVWSELIEWNEERGCIEEQMKWQPHEVDLRDKIESTLQGTVVEDVLFAAGSRDFEIAPPWTVVAKRDSSFIRCGTSCRLNYQGAHSKTTLGGKWTRAR